MIFACTTHNWVNSVDATEKVPFINQVKASHKSRKLVKVAKLDDMVLLRYSGVVTNKKLVTSICDQIITSNLDICNSSHVGPNPYYIHTRACQSKMCGANNHTV